jgi:hypothetical protein
MSSSASSPADVLNIALRRIGYKLRVGSLQEGSFAAKQALDLYAQTRDQVMREGEWGFAERNVAMILQKSAPANGYVPPITWNPLTNPPIGWLYQYSRPSDCLKIRAVKPTPLFVPNFDPQPNIFGEANDDTQSPAVQVILCNVPNALLVYTGQVTDPTTWEADFVSALADELGRGLAPVLATLQQAQMIAAEGAQDKAVAEYEQG